jgi:hypothetical protein
MPFAEVLSEGVITSLSELKSSPEVSSEHDEGSSYRTLLASLTKTSRYLNTTSKTSIETAASYETLAAKSKLDPKSHSLTNLQRKSSVWGRMSTNQILPRRSSVGISARSVKKAGITSKSTNSLSYLQNV